MNAPLLQRDACNGDATLQLFALFHLNIAFSSIEEEQRDEVIARCYWPLLELAKAHGPIGVEATGFTLEEIAARDPLWCAEARRLVADGRIEPIGSGYAQIIGPLVPARVTQANLRIGHEIYERVLGQRPSLALVNEQAYSAGLVGLYLDAGYRAILMDWDNPAAHHPEWPAETRYRPQRASGACGRSIALLWTNTVAFQKLQRFAHGDIALEDYVGYVDQQRSAIPRTLCLYASDAEIFDFRPGRYRTEETLRGESEWGRIGRAFARLRSDRRNAIGRARRRAGSRLERSGNAAAPRKCGLPRAGEKTAEIQSLALGRHRSRRPWHQRGLRTHLSRDRRVPTPATTHGKSFAICGRAIFAPTSPNSAGRHFVRAWRRRRSGGLSPIAIAAPIIIRGKRKRSSRLG